MALLDDLLENDYDASVLSSSTGDETADIASSQTYNSNFRTPSFYASEDDKKNGKVKDRDAYLKEWEEANPYPEAPTYVATPDTTTSTNDKASYNELLAEYERMDPTKKDKARRAKEKLASLSDGISAIANLIATTQGAPSSFDPTKGMTETMRKRYDAVDNERKNYINKYYDLLMRKAAIDARANKTTGTTAQDKINKANQTAYNNASKAWLAQRNKDVDALGREYDRQWRDDNASQNRAQALRIAGAPVTSSQTNTSSKTTPFGTETTTSTSTRTTKKKI